MTDTPEEHSPPLRHTLSLAEVEAQCNPTPLSTEFSLDFPTEDDIRLKRLQAIVDDLTAQLRNRDNSYSRVVEQLAEERARRQSCEQECDSLRRENGAVDDLHGRIQNLEKQLEDQCRLAEENDLRFLDAIRERDERVSEMEHKVVSETRKVEELTRSLQDVESLRKRCKDLEYQLSTEKALSATKIEQHDATVPSDEEMFTKSFVKRKMFELKIARNVIVEKDKILKEMRGEVQHANDRASIAEGACRNNASRVGALEKKIGDMNKELSNTREEVCMKQIMVEEANQKVEALEGEKQLAKKDTAAALVAANENEEKRRECKELLESTARRCQEALAEKQASIEELERLRESLTAAEQEISRLGDILQREGNDESLGSTSPCSLLTDADAAQSTTSRTTRVQSLAELEEAASVVSSIPTPAKHERNARANPRSEEETTIENLSKSLRASRMYCNETNEQLQEATALVARQEESLKRISRELAVRKEECGILENRVHKELTPALNAANRLLENKQDELKIVLEEFDLYREMAEKTRSALELEVGSITERLESTSATLQDTNGELCRSQQREGDLEVQLADLKEQRREIQEQFAQLEQSNEHRRQSLCVMQERLSTIEFCAATHEQTVTDAAEDKERLQRLLSHEVDRREVAEKRATRKDGMVHKLEARTLELERNHAALKEHLVEKTEHLRDVEKELKDTKEVAQLRDEALQEQADMSQRRGELFESLTGELRMVIQGRDAELRDTKEGLSNVEKRLKSLSKCLEEERSKLKARERDLADMVRKFSNSEAENRRKETKLSEAEDQYSRLAAEYQAAQEELQNREKQIASHLSSISQKSGKIVGLRAEKTELEKTIRELRSLVDEERTKFGSQFAARKKLEEDVTALQSKLTTCEDNLSMRDLEVDTLSRSLTNTQDELLKLETVIRDKEEEISASTNTIGTLEKALERSNHQLTVLESHLDGHDTLLKDNREKDESLAVKSGELNQATELISQMEKDMDLLRQKVTSKEVEADSLSREVTTLAAVKDNVEEELQRAKKARTSVEKSLNDTAASLAALEKSTTEEIADLNATISSLKKVIDEKDSSLNSASETIAQSSIQSNLTKEQLIDSRTRGDRLFSRLTATEYELASKKESLVALEQRYSEIQDTLKGREEELENLGKTLMVRDQTLSSTKATLDEMRKKASTITEGELLTMQTKLEAKEKAIANLHNWCCFINGKLHASEKALSERDMDLEVSSTAFKKLEAQLRSQNELLSEKESQLRKLDSARVVENSELRSRIHALQSYVDEAKAELERTKQIMSSKGSETHSSLVAVSEELVECKAQLKSMEKEMCEILSRKQKLEETVKTYERDLAASERTIECLTLDLGRLQSESSSKRDAKDANDKNAAEEIVKVRSETGYLIVELRRAEAELSAANDTAKTWQQKAEELQPLAESTLEAQRAVEIVSSQLALLQKDSKRRVDLLETQLEEAERERDAAERDCSAAIADYAAMRARLMECHSRGTAYGRLAAANSLCTVTFVLEGRDAPGADVMVYILGDDAALGQWDPSRRLPVRVVGEGSNGIVRKCEVVLPADLATAYKYAADTPGGSLMWEGDDNRPLELHGDATRELKDVWRPPR